MACALDVDDDVMRSADLDLGEVHDLGAVDHLGDGQLVILGVRLFEQHDVLEEAIQATFDDLGNGLVRLALVAR